MRFCMPSYQAGARLGRDCRAEGRGGDAACRPPMCVFNRTGHDFILGCADVGPISRRWPRVTDVTDGDTNRRMRELLRDLVVDRSVYPQVQPKRAPRATGASFELHFMVRLPARWSARRARRKPVSADPGKDGKKKACISVTDIVNYNTSSDAPSQTAKCALRYF